MPHDLCFRILMFENRQQVKQRKTLRLRSRICRTAFFIQSTFIADSNTVPVVLFKPIYVSCYYNQ